MRILVAIDGSDSATLAVDLVANVAWPGGTAIRVVEAIETGAALFGGPWPTLALVQADEIEERLRLGANATVQEAAELLRRWPIFARSSMRVVSVADSEISWWPDFPGEGSPELMEIYFAAADTSRSRHDLLTCEMTVELEAAGLTAEADRREGDAATEILAARRTADGIVRRAGVDRVLAEVPPQDKAREVRKLQVEGRTVAMFGRFKAGPGPYLRADRTASCEESGEDSPASEWACY